MSKFPPSEVKLPRMTGQTMSKYQITEIQDAASLTYGPPKEQFVPHGILWGTFEFRTPTGRGNLSALLSPQGEGRVSDLGFRASDFCSMFL